MNFEATKQLLDVVGRFIQIENINVQSDGNRDWRGREYIADYVEIIKEQPNRIGFEVVEEEIVIFFFTDHIHFEDYSSALNNDGPDYVARAIEFLKMLFTLPIERRYTTKGEKITRDASYFILSNGKRESCAGITFSSAGLKNIFKKSVKHIEIKKFDNQIGDFVSNPL